MKPNVVEGKLLLRELGLFAGANATVILPLVFLATGFKIFIPFLARKYVYGSYTIFNSWEDYVYTISQMIVQFMFTPNYVFVIAGFIDF
jgi:hypothetical protein